MANKKKKKVLEKLITKCEETINKIKNNKFFSKIDINIIFIILVGILIMYPLISSKYMWGHDSRYHYANIYATLQTMRHSIFPNKILPIIAYNFGWAEGIFYPQLPHYLTAYIYSIVKYIGITNIFTSMKIVHLLVIIASGIVMYFLAQKIFKSKAAGLASALIYMMFPYHFIDIFVRDAFCENFMFIFTPLVFLGLLYLLEGNKKKFYLCFVSGYVFAINSHLISAIYLTVFALIYLLFNIKKVFNKETIKTLIIASVMILILSAPFLISLIEHAIYGKYVAFNDDVMYGDWVFTSTTVSLKDYFSTAKPLAWTGELVFTISYIGLIGFVISTIYLIVCDFKKIKKYNYLWVFIFLTVLTVLFMHPIFPWEMLPKFFASIEFLWRLNLFLAFFMSIVAGLTIKLINKDTFKIAILGCIFVFAFYQMHTFNQMVIMQNYDLDNFDVDSNGHSAYQYIPYNAYHNLEYAQNRGNDILVKDGSADIKVIKKEFPYLEFEISNNEGATLELPRYYFRGYEIKINGEKLNYFENNLGFISIKPNTNGIVKVSYTGGTTYKIALAIFTGGLIIIGIYLCKNCKTKIKIKGV